MRFIGIHVSKNENLYIRFDNNSHLDCTTILLIYLKTRANKEEKYVLLPFSGGGA